MRRRPAVEPVIGHMKAEHRMGRNYLKGRDGDRINAVLAAAGYNFSLLLRWLERLLRTLIPPLLTALSCTQTAYRMLPNGSSRTTIPCTGRRARRSGASTRKQHKAWTQRLRSTGVRQTSIATIPSSRQGCDTTSRYLSDSTTPCRWAIWEIPSARNSSL